MTKSRSIWVLVIVLIALAGSFGIQNLRGGEVGENFDNGKVACIDPDLPIPASLHWHQNLEIIIDGEKVAIPPDVGIEPNCHRVLHTHDESGEIHIEPNKEEVFYLGDFFSVWGQEFNSGQILGKKVDSNHELTMRVNGELSQDFDNLILEDNQQIKIEYKTIKR